MSLPYDSEHDVGIRLDTEEGCAAELQRVSNNMAELTQQYTETVEEQRDVGALFRSVKAIVSKTIRDGTEAKLTAAEVDARFTDAIDADETFSAIRDKHDELEASEKTLDRRLRTLEKRESGAQSALNKHQNDNRRAAYGNGQ